MVWRTGYDESVYVVQASDLVKLGSRPRGARSGSSIATTPRRRPGFIQGTIGYEVYAASLMWNWQITPSLSLTNAVRVDDLHLRYSGTPAAGSGI